MPLGATETGLGAVTARGWGMGSHQQLAGLGGPTAGDGLLGWAGLGWRAQRASWEGQFGPAGLAGLGGL